MRHVRRMVLAISTSVAAAALGGCGGVEGSALDAVPDAEAVTLEVTGAAAELGPATGAGAEARAASSMAAAAEPGWPDTGVDLTAAQRKIAAVNFALRRMIAHVEAVALTQGAPGPGESAWYGPADRCTVEVAPGGGCPADATANLRLWIRRGPAGGAGVFVLQARSAGATDETAFGTVAAGTLARGAIARRGRGQLWLNLDALRSAAPAYPGAGALYAGFFAGPVAKAEVLALAGFTPDAGNADWPPATVGLRGVKTALGTARVRVAAVRDLVRTTADTELGLAHVVWNPSLGGRAYALVGAYEADGITHGDVPADRYFFGRSCYAPHAPEAPIFKEWFDCPKTQGPTACALDAGNPRFVEVGTSWSACAVAGEPDELAPPEAGPGVDAGAQEPAFPGEDSGMAPEPVPAAGEVPVAG